MTAHPYQRKWLFRLLAAGVSTLLGLLILGYVANRQGWLVLESGRVRLSRPPLYLQEPGHEVTGHRYLYDPTLGWRNIPNWQATTHGRRLTINANGLRDRDHPFAKPPGTKRILVLGDSYAWGYGVADSELFTQLLETRLVHSSWQVINAGVSGWGTDQQFLFLKQEGIKYRPDVVIVAFFLANDIDNNSAAQQYGLHKPVFVDYDLTLGNVPVPRPHQPIDSAVRLKVSRMNPVRLTVSILEGIARFCAERECQLVVAKFGLFLAPKLPYAIELDREFTQAMDEATPRLFYLDLDDEFVRRDLETQSLLEGNDDGHWNSYGHEQVALILEEFLMQKGIVDE